MASIRKDVALVNLAVQDADEYLRQVQWERLHCPQAKIVEALHGSLQEFPHPSQDIKGTQKQHEDHIV